MQRLRSTVLALLISAAISSKTWAQEAAPSAPTPEQPGAPAAAPIEAPAAEPTPVAEPATPEATAAPAAAEPPPASAPVDPSPDAAAPAADAPVHVAPEPAPPAPARTPLGGPPVTVENWPRESTARDDRERNYQGVSVRLSAQLGLARATRDLDEDRTRITGPDGGVMLDVGAAVIPNLVLYGRVGGFALNHASGSDSPNAGSAYFGLLGAGARYHVMPNDWYGSAMLALALASTTDDLGVVENADPGFGLQLEAGKNWIAGPDTSQATIGLGLRFSYVRCGSLGDIDEPWIGTALSAVFSVAYDAGR